MGEMRTMFAAEVFCSEVIILKTGITLGVSAWESIACTRFVYLCRIKLLMANRTGVLRSHICMVC